MISETFRKLRMPPDTFERHTLIGRLAGSPASVLDVGGIKGELSLFLPDSAITTINMAGEDADAHFDGDRLPFGDQSFDAAVSLDVLEHIPAAGRVRHITELVRVARRCVIICCPLGSPEHIAAEAELAAEYATMTGERHRFLDEHLERGLPSEEELRSLGEASGRTWRLRFHGDFRRANLAFQMSTRLKAKPGPGSALAYSRLRLDPRRSLKLEDTSRPESNRAYLEIDPARMAGQPV
ncbi:MAG: methyltransferase domain-containing protein [Solirubrobacterales bacterium]|nr:methyltransferase domain-containing protein [Solirubrobacterales bacterium]